MEFNGTRKWLMMVLATVASGWILCASAGGLNVWHKQGEIKTKVERNVKDIEANAARIKALEDAISAVKRIEGAVDRIEKKLE